VISKPKACPDGRSKPATGPPPPGAVKKLKLKDSGLHSSELAAENARGAHVPVRLKACVTGEVKVLFRYTLSGL